MREKTVPAQPEKTVTEIIIACSISYINGTVQFAIADATEVDGELVPDLSTTEYVNIQGPEFDELMGESPEWAPGKPADVFRPADLFSFLDKRRDEAAAKPDKKIRKGKSK